MDYYVYALVDPINKIPFYIGKGRKDRCYSHLKGRSNYNDDKLNYIKNIRSLGFEPVVYKIFENLTNEDSLSIEKILIDYYKTYLTNMEYLVPDRTGSKLSENHKKILREKNLGKNLTEEHKKKIGISNQHIPNYDIEKSYKDESSKRNEGSKNPNSKKVLCNGILFGCMKDAYTFYKVSKQTFKKRYDFEIIANL